MTGDHAGEIAAKVGRELRFGVECQPRTPLQGGMHQMGVIAEGRARAEERRVSRAVAGSKDAIDRASGGLERRQAVIIVGGMEQLDVVDRSHAVRHFARNADSAATNGVLERLGPTVSAGHHLHPVGAQDVQFAQISGNRNGLDVGVARHEQEADKALHEVRPSLVGVRLADQ